METKNEKKMYLLMTLCTTFWAGAFVAGKFSVSEFPPFSLTFLRFAIASVIISFIMMKREKQRRIDLKDIPYITALGIIGMFGYHVLFFTALKYTTAINSSLIAAINPLITTVLAAVFLKDKLTLKQLGAILISLVGVIFTITGGDIKSVFNNGFNTGDLLMLAAVLCWAVYLIMSKRLASKYRPIVLTTYSFIVCSIVLIPFVIYENPSSFIMNTTASGWGAVIYMAVFPSVIGYLVQQTSLKIIGPRRTTVFLNLVPIFSIILSILILGEGINAIKILSSILTVSGVFLTTKLKS